MCWKCGLEKMQAGVVSFYTNEEYLSNECTEQEKDEAEQVLWQAAELSQLLTGIGVDSLPESGGFSAEISGPAAADSQPESGGISADNAADSQTEAEKPAFVTPPVAFFLRD